jgi:hypothetical protein
LKPQPTRWGFFRPKIFSRSLRSLDESKAPNHLIDFVLFNNGARFARFKNLKDYMDPTGLILAKA